MGNKKKTIMSWWRVVSGPMRSVTWKMMIVIIISNKQWTFPEIPNFQYFHSTSSLLHYFCVFPHHCYSISLLSLVSRLAYCALPSIIELNNCICIIELYEVLKNPDISPGGSHESYIRGSI